VSSASLCIFSGFYYDPVFPESHPSCLAFFHWENFFLFPLSVLAPSPNFFQPGTFLRDRQPISLSAGHDLFRPERPLLHFMMPSPGALCPSCAYQRACGNFFFPLRRRPRSPAELTLSQLEVQKVSTRSFALFLLSLVLIFFL